MSKKWTSILQLFEIKKVVDWYRGSFIKIKNPEENNSGILNSLSCKYESFMFLVHEMRFLPRFFFPNYKWICTQCTCTLYIKTTKTLTNTPRKVVQKNYDQVCNWRHTAIISKNGNCRHCKQRYEYIQ